jgi:multidrug efflux pump subunit AcrA (membrane-fusion protein)
MNKVILLRLTETRNLFIFAGILFLVIISLSYILYNKKETIALPVVSDAVDAVYALGTVKSDSVQIIKAGIPGIAIKRFVKEGEKVRAGQSLLTTDSSTVHASISGIITKLTVNQNDTIITGQEIIRVTDITKLFIVIALDQKSILFIKEGQPAEISFEGIREKKINGVVYSSEIPEGVLPEMTCDVVIETGRRPGAFFVPSAAIIQGNLTFIRKGKKESVPVTTGAAKDKLTEIISPELLPDDQIIVP